MTKQVLKLAMDAVSEDVYLPKTVKDVIEKDKDRIVKSLMAIPKFDHEKLHLKEYSVFEWFEVHLYRNGCLIKSGLRHADGITLSPFHYEESFWGEGYQEKALDHFNDFLKKRL